MQRNSFQRMLCSLLILIAGSISAWADEPIHVETAGTLSSQLTGSETTLTLSGSLNGSDIKCLRELATSGRLTTLDLSAVHIVGGGDAYYESFTTEDNVIGNSMFRDCSKLRNIELPSTVTAIETNAFSKSALRKIDIPNTVTRIGGDAFAYCSALATVVIGSRVARLDQGVFYSSNVRTVYVKPVTPIATPSYLFSSNPKIIVYSTVLEDYRQSSWAEYGTIVGGLENYYPMAEDEGAKVNALLPTFFDDYACTALKADYAAMSDEALSAAFAEAEMPDFMTAIALKLKNKTWGTYEQQFRIHQYTAYSDANYWNDRLMSSGGSYMGNPTGIYADSFEPLYVFVDSEVPEDTTLYLAPCEGNTLVTNAKTGHRLKRGLNIIDGQKDALYYVLYTADTREQTKTLDQWPPITIHIEGGIVNGYYDASHHNDREYATLLRAATHELFTVKGSQALFNFRTSSYKSLFPTSIDRNICWYDSLTVWQKELMGMCHSVASGQRAAAPHCLTGGEDFFPGYYNNPNFAIEGTSADAGYANSSPYRTCYNSVECIRNSFDVTRAEHDDWCASHESGHNNQRAINLEGGTEVSNNLFSNVVRYLTGRVTSGGAPLSQVMDEYSRHIPFFVRPVDSQMRMYYQLYLYYHQARHNTSFYPNLFAELRRDPLELYQSGDKSALKFVRKVCEVAGEDLTDFFAAWGFFEPFSNMSIKDYGAHTYTIRQAEIDRTLDAISQYPKNRQILFVEDRVDYVLTRDFVTTGGQHRRESEKVGQCGDLGQFTSYMTGAEPSAYTYLQSDSLYAMNGTGGVGFLVLGPDNALRYASNAFNFCIPTAAGDDFSIYSIDADGTLHPTAKAGIGEQYVHLDRAGTLKEELEPQVIKATIDGPINGTDIKYLRELLDTGNLASLDLTTARTAAGGSAYYESYRTSANAISSHAFHGCAQLISIRLPERTTRIEANAFSNSGLHEAWIPDNVTSVGVDAYGYCPSLTRVVIGPSVRTLSQGVFYSSPVTDAYVLAKTPPAVASYLFSSKPVIHVYASSLEAYKASPWAEFGTIVGDLDDMEQVTPLEAPHADAAATATPAPVYDLFGRRVTHPQPGSVYIRNGRKFVTAP